MTPGWSAVGGQTRSAYETDPPPDKVEVKPGLSAVSPNSSPLTMLKADRAKPCGGSSSGSAVGVSAGFAPLSLGTETGGSCVYPASKAGLYSVKPGRGYVSANGVFRISRSFDAIGAMARTPCDLSLLTESILTPEARSKLPESGFQNSLTGSWQGLKVGILPSTWGIDGDAKNKLKWETSPVVVLFKLQGILEADGGVERKL
jgi:amidase